MWSQHLGSHSSAQTLKPSGSTPSHHLQLTTKTRLMYLQNIPEPEPSTPHWSLPLPLPLSMAQKGPNKTQIRCLQDSKPTKGSSFFPVLPATCLCSPTLDLGLACAQSHHLPSPCPHPNFYFLFHSTCVSKTRCTVTICFSAVSDPVRMGLSWEPAEHRNSDGRCCMNHSFRTVCHFSFV